MLTISYGTISASKTQVIDYINSSRLHNSKFSVIDIGGFAGGWTNTIADMIVDINVPSSSTTINMDICNQDDWSKLSNIVSKNGKYDYAICTHTLEDVYNPIVALNYLPRIAKAGIITMPCILTELSRIENPNWLGYIHHRWIFNQSNGEMLIIPKLNVLESLVGVGLIYDPTREEIRFEWQDDIPYKIFMNNYLGPDAQTVIDNYKKLRSL